MHERQKLREFILENIDLVEKKSSSKVDTAKKIAAGTATAAGAGYTGRALGRLIRLKKGTKEILQTLKDAGGDELSKDYEKVFKKARKRLGKRAAVGALGTTLAAGALYKTLKNKKSKKK